MMRFQQESFSYRRIPICVTLLHPTLYDLACYHNKDVFSHNMGKHANERMLIVISIQSHYKRMSWFYSIQLIQKRIIPVTTILMHHTFTLMTMDVNCS
jgi:hypothetical protein